MTLHEQGYMHDAIEIQLAHTVGNAVPQAYNYVQHLEYRTKMMQEWPDFIDSFRKNNQYINKIFLNQIVGI